MAILDPKERIIDIQLTDRGRELLAQNQLNFVYYAFSDEGVNYSGSLNLTSVSSSIDPVVFRNMSFEETQRKNSDLSTFLYTIPLKSKKVPQFVASVNTGSLLTLDRKYQTVDVALKNYNYTFNSTPLDFIIRATAPLINRNTLQIFLNNINKVLKK